MNRVLILNLRRFGDIFTTANQINSIKKDDPNAIVDILVFKEFKRAATCLKNIDSVFTIDRKSIQTFRKNSIYSDGFAIEQIFNDLEEIQSNEYSSIVNYSFDETSCYLTPYLSSENTDIVGPYFSSENILQYSNNWSLVLNEVLANSANSPFNYSVFSHYIGNVPWSSKNTDHLITTDKYEEVARNTFLEIRNTVFSNSSINPKLIAVPLLSSTASKSIQKDVFYEFLDLLNKDQELFPIVIHSSSTEEINFAKEIGEYFENAIVTVESDFNSLPSVLKNIDLLVTPCTAIKHVADLVNTPVIEVSLGEAPIFKQSTIGLSSYIITDSLENRNYKHFYQNKSNTKSKVTANDLIETTRFFFNEDPIKSLNLSEEVSLYEVTNDHLGISYNWVQGSCPTKVELDRQLSRNSIIRVLTSTEVPLSNTTHFHVSNEAITNWFNEKKLELTDYMKSILSSIKCLRSSKTQGKLNQDFFITLDKLINFSPESSFAPASVIFKDSIEKVSTTNDVMGFLNKTEKELFSLKNNVQVILNSVDEIYKGHTEANKAPVLAQQREMQSGQVSK